jgi:hypothetical protein
MAARTAHAAQQNDDYHYPLEEPAELAATEIPELVSANPPNMAVLRLKGKDLNVTVGAVAFDRWHVLSILTGTVALECNFQRWGLLAFVHRGSDPTLLRKSVGELSGIKQPYYNFTANDPHYFDKAAYSLTDSLYEQAVNQTDDNELTYASAASTLAPQRDYASISNNEDVVKFVVTYIGRVKCAVNNNTHTSPNASPIQTGGITELQNLHAPMPNMQTIVFDPAKHLTFWPSRFGDTKAGLVGGHTMIANVGAFTSERGIGRGFELIAFSPVASAAAASPAASASASAANKPPAPPPSSSASSSNDLPRQPGINYAPTVLVRLREQDGPCNPCVFNGRFKYYRASNNTVGSSPEPITPVEFYTALAEYNGHYQKVLAPAMKVQLPEGDRRQVMW